MGGCTFSNTFFSPSSSSFSSFYNAARLHAAAALQQPHTQEFQKEVKPLFSFPPLSLLFTLNVKIQVCLKKSFIKLQCQSEITHTAANYYFLLKPIIDHLKRRRLLWSFWVVFNSHWTQLMTWSGCSFLSKFFQTFCISVYTTTHTTHLNKFVWVT